LRYIDIAILTGKNFDGNFVLACVADDLVNERWQAVDGLHWPSDAHRLDVIRPLVASSKALVVDHVAAVFLCCLDCRLVTAHRFRK